MASSDVFRSQNPRTKLCSTLEDFPSKRGYMFWFRDFSTTMKLSFCESKTSSKQCRNFKGVPSRNRHIETRQTLYQLWCIISCWISRTVENYKCHLNLMPQRLLYNFPRVEVGNLLWQQKFSVVAETTWSLEKGPGHSAVLGCPRRTLAKSLVIGHKL